MVLPAVKLGVLALKTLSKPLANAVKRRAASHPRFRESIIGIAQSYHKLNVNLQRRLYGHATNVDIKPLNEAAAVATAADLVGELVVFGVGGGLVILEVSRSAISESKKEEARRQEREALRQKDKDLQEEIESVKRRIEALESEMRGTWLPRLSSHQQKQDPAPAQAAATS